MFENQSYCAAKVKNHTRYLNYNIEIIFIIKVIVACHGERGTILARI